MTTEDGLGKPSLMTKDPRFSPLVIALAYADPKASSVARSVLECLGCRGILLARDGPELIGRLRTEPVDLAVADWSLRTTSAAQAVRRLRADAAHPRRDLPVIVLAPGQRHDAVGEARDAGVNEVVTKPMTARSLLACVYAVIERPRPLVLSPGYVGPDRRWPSSFNMLLPASPPKSDRRRQAPAELVNVRQATALAAGAAATVAPDFRLKKKMGLALPSAVTPPADLVSSAEERVGAARSVFAGEAAGRAAELMMLSRLLIGRPERVLDTVGALRQSAAWVKSQADEFGYGRIADVAGLLIDFCDRHFTPERPGSLLLLEKHALTLIAVLRAGPEAAAGPVGEGLIRDLAQQVSRLKDE